RTRRRLDLLQMMRAEVAELVPLHAGLRVIAVGRDLHHGAWPMLVVPAEAAHEFLLPAVTPEFELVLLDGVNAKFRGFAGAHALGPGIPEECVGQQAKLIRLPRLRRHAHALAAETRLG